MATTTNYGWTTPDDTSLVKDGAAAIRTLGSSIDSSMAQLKGGTTGQVLSKTSNTDMAFTWVAQDDSNAIQNALLTTTGDTIYASGASTPARLGIGTTGQVLTVAGGVPSWATPTTALTWTSRLAPTGTRINAIAYNGSNLWVAVGNSGTLYSSTNGTTWTSRTSGFGTNNILFVAFGNGLWVAVGVNGTITTSTDGTTWTARTSNMSTNTINAVTYANSLWVAVGNGGGTTNTGGITYSTDGITWTRKSQSLTVGANYTSLVWNGTNWIVGATHSTNNHLYASAPSGTWTAGATGSAATINQIFWDGTRHTTSEGGGFYYSTSTTLGTTTGINTVDGINQLNSNFFYNNEIYVPTIFLSKMTPVSTNYATTHLIGTLPLAFTATTTANNASSFIWVGSQGYIFATTWGNIYTSF